MNLSNLLTSSAISQGMSNHPPQGTLAGAKFPGHPQGSLLPMNRQQFPRMPALMQQQLLGSIPSLNIQQLASGTSSTSTDSGADEQRSLEGPVPKKIKVYVRRSALVVCTIGTIFSNSVFW